MADLILASVIAVRDRLVEMCAASWGLTRPVALGRSFTSAERGPLAVVALREVPHADEGARSKVETYAFSVGLRRPMHAGDDLDAIRVECAQAFGAAFLDEHWVDLGVGRPLILNVAFPPADLADGFFDLYLSVSLQTSRFQ